MKITLVMRPYSDEKTVALVTAPQLTQEIFKHLLVLRDSNPIIYENVEFGNKDGMLLVTFNNENPKFSSELVQSINDALNASEQEIARQKKEAEEKNQAEAARRDKILLEASKAFKVDIQDEPFERNLADL